MRQRNMNHAPAQDKSGGVNAADAGEAGVKGATGASVTGGGVP
jgi:hypothetical protein